MKLFSFSFRRRYRGRPFAGLVVPDGPPSAAPDYRRVKTDVPALTDAQRELRRSLGLRSVTEPPMHGDSAIMERLHGEFSPFRVVGSLEFGVLAEAAERIQDLENRLRWSQQREADLRGRVAALEEACRHFRDGE